MSSFIIDFKPIVLRAVCCVQVTIQLTYQKVNHSMNYIPANLQVKKLEVTGPNKQDTQLDYCRQSDIVIDITKSTPTEYPVVPTIHHFLMAQSIMVILILGKDQQTRDIQAQQQCLILLKLLRDLTLTCLNSLGQIAPTLHRPCTSVLIVTST